MGCVWETGLEQQSEAWAPLSVWSSATWLEHGSVYFLLNPGRVKHLNTSMGDIIFTILFPHGLAPDWALRCKLSFTLRFVVLITEVFVFADSPGAVSNV